MDVRIFKKEQEFVAAAMVRILQACETPQGDRARVALSGGSTPVAVYQALATQADFLEATEFYQVDERVVPLTDPRSNQKLIQASLKPINFYPFNTTLPIPDALASYESTLRALAPHPFDVVILGIGEDGHTASLFPNDPALTEMDHWTAHTTTQVHEGHDRLTLTFPPILASKALLVLLKGASKRSMVEKLMSGTGNVKKNPALKLIGHSNLTVYFLDITT